MPRTRIPRESTIVRQIMAKGALIEGLCLRKRHGTAFTTAGDPDITGCYRGRHIEYEVKRPGEQPRLNQHARMDEWRRAGAHVGWGTSWTEFIVWLRQIDKETP